jgi:hypothetical protein
MGYSARLLGTTRVASLINDEAAAVAAGAKSPEQAAQTIENSWSDHRI